LNPDGYHQFNTAYVEIPKKQGKSELVAATLLLTCAVTSLYICHEDDAGYRHGTIDLASFAEWS
jgi:hypothetical protein